MNGCLDPIFIRKSIIGFGAIIGAKISKVDVKGSAQAFVRVEGKGSSDIKLSKNKTKGIQKTIYKTPEVKADVVLK